MRYLAIDLGTKRTGLAVGDRTSGIISPIGAVHARVAMNEDTFELLIVELKKKIEDHQPDAIVIGLPLNMDGSKGPGALQVEKLGRLLQKTTSCEVYFQDERLTSFAADQAMAQTGRTHKQKKQLRDALAAVEILRDYFSKADE